MFKNILNALAGNPYEREIERYSLVVEQVNALEPEMQARSDEELRALTGELRDHVQQALAGPLAEVDSLREELTTTVGEEERRELALEIEQAEEAYQKAERAILDEILPTAFAATREASVRATGMRHFDVQIIGGIAMHEGKIAEMKTGEGKTLVASLSLYLNALTGRGTHLVTVNDYLARRDGGWMGRIYHQLGLTVGVIGKEQFSAIYDPEYVDPGGSLEDERLVHWRPTLRQECYQAAITYGTASEFGFDYLRDNTSSDPARLVQREHVYAIVDEVDSVLIDGARTPLIISGPAGQASSTYMRFADIVEKSRLRRNTTDLEFEEPDGDYVFDDRTQTVSLTERGIEKIERQLPEIDVEGGESIYDPQHYELVHYLDNALKAKYIFQRDKDYIVQGGNVILIDQTTGRPMPSRRYSEGLHQAIEAKEGVQVKREDVTIATITVQNYFRLYDKLAGMTGTAVTQAEEFDEVYELDVIAIPTNVEFQAQQGELDAQEQKVGDILPVLVTWDFDEDVNMVGYYVPDNGSEPSFFRRVDFPDQVYQSINGKEQAVAEEIAQVAGMGRPVLVGTGSVEASESLSKRLKKMGLAHEVLNAKNHQREALIVAQAGRPGAITISTSMAGRGTDILLGGNPEGLAAEYIAKRLFDANDFHPLVADVVRGDVPLAYSKAAGNPALTTELVDWIVKANKELKRKAQVEDVLGAVVEEIREDPVYEHVDYALLVRVIQEIDLSNIDRSRMEKAREILEANDLPLSLLPDLQYRLGEYRSLSGLLGEAQQIDTLMRQLFEQHYNARAALIRAVLANDLDEARALCTQIPALPENLIEEVQAIRAECQANRDSVWQQGGLHVIGTERHESRRIDDQLRGRAARQGDPGSSRFYLSLEDDLMLRFGGDRTKRIMERLNIPDDMPISAGILSNVIEQAQGRFENFNFDIRKNLVEYDEAVNRQRQIVYDERTAILQGTTGELDSLVRRFIEHTIEHTIAQLTDGYEAWATTEIETTLTDYSNIETGEVNARGVVQRALALIPRPTEEELQNLLAIIDGEELLEVLHEHVLDAIDENHNYRMLFADLARIVPPWPVLPSVTAQGIEGWEAFTERLKATFDSYVHFLPDASEEALWQPLAEKLETARRDYIANVGQGTKVAEAQNRLQNQLGQALGDSMVQILTRLEPYEIIEAMLARVDQLLNVARMDPVSPADNGDGDRVLTAERRLYAIGEEELQNYQRALMLSVIDMEWRQYLTAIDDLRQGIGLEAFGQRDPKVEFKRRAFDMFNKLREDVEEGIARRFFNEIPRHRQVVEAQKQREAQLDNLAKLGYRVERRVTQDTSGRTQVAQVVHRDLWSNVDRNDPCPCGSGKKFKNCHYRQIQKQQQTVDIDQVRSGGGGSKRGRRRR
jgi:preprotein translocase subunit SecA